MSLEAFRQSQLAAPRQYDDWQTWLSSQKFYGAISDEDIQAIEPPDAMQQSTIARMFASGLGRALPEIPAENRPLLVDEYLDFTVKSIFWGPSRSDYDTESQTWTLCIPQHSENYGDFIRELAILRTVAQYKDLPGEDFILIYPYFWGGSPNTFVTIHQGSSILKNEAPAQAIAEADAALQSLIRNAYQGEI